MDVNLHKAKRGLILKTWERCRSVGRKDNTNKRGTPIENKHRANKKRRVAPEGCFSVYVGPQKQRFVIKTEYLNHPLFKALLEEAENEYGYNSEGPLALPCNVDSFYEVLLEMDYNEIITQGCGFKRAPTSPYRRLSPARIVSINSTCVY